MTDICTDSLTHTLVCKFRCDNCHFKCSNKYDYTRHLQTRKHKRLINTNENVKITQYSCLCGKKYKHSQSLYNHKKKCNFIENNNNNNDDDINDEFKELIMKLLTENQEMRKIMQDQQKQIGELIPMIGNNNNNNNTTKNTINVNMFLNDKCKNALSLNEFIETIKVSLQNLLLTSDKGLGEGLSNIIIEHMNKLSIYERPIHCTDKKRETIYIKDPEWEKDEKKELINKLLNKVERKQVQTIQEWTDKYPNYMDHDKLQNEYINIVRNCTSSMDKCKDKVIRKVCDNVYLTEKERV